MVSLSSKIFRGMNLRLSSESRHTGFHVFRRMGGEPPGVPLDGQDLTSKDLHSANNPGACGEKKQTRGLTRVLNTIKTKLYFKPNWFRSSRENESNDVEFPEANASLCTQDSYGRTKTRSIEDTETIQEATDAGESDPLTSFPIKQDNLGAGLGLRAKISDILNLRSYLKSLSLNTNSRRVSDAVSIFILLSAEEFKSKASNPAFPSYESGVRKSDFIVLMAHKVKDFTRLLFKRWARTRTHESRTRLRRFAKETFVGHIRWLNIRRGFALGAAGLEAGDSTGDTCEKNRATLPEISLEVSSFGGSNILEPSFFSTEEILDQPYEYWDLGPESPGIHIFGNIPDLMEDFSEFEYLKDSGTEIDTIDFLTLTSYYPDTFTKETALSQYGLPDFRTISRETEEEEEFGLALKLLLEFPAINFSSPDFLDPPEVRDTKAKGAFLQPPEVAAEPAQCAVQKVATPPRTERTEQWEDAGMVLACLEYAFPNVAPIVDQADLEKKWPHTVASDNDSEIEVNFDTETLARTRTSEYSASFGNDEQETTVSSLGGAYDLEDSITLDSAEIVLSNLDLTDSQLTYRILPDEDDVESWACSPPLRLKIMGVDFGLDSEIDEYAELATDEFATSSSIREILTISGHTTSNVLNSGYSVPDFLEPWQYELDFELMHTENSPEVKVLVAEESPSEISHSDSTEENCTEQPETPVELSGEYLTEGPIFEENVESYTTKTHKRVHFDDIESEPSSKPRSETKSTDLNLIPVKYNFYGTTGDLMEEGEEADEGFLSDKEDDIMLEALFDKDRLKEVGGTEYLADKCRRKLFNSTSLWTKTGLLLLEFEESKPISNGEPQITIKFADSEENHGSSKAGCSSYVPENKTQDLPIPETILELENRLIQTGSTNNIEEAQYLLGIIFNYRRVFMHLVKNVVLPCNKKITQLVEDILSVRKMEAELYSLGAGITNEISIMSESLEDKDRIDFPYWQTRLTRCHSGLADIDKKLEKFHDHFDNLRSGFGDRITEINDRITSIRIIRDRILEKYYLFYEPNKLQASFGTQNVHQWTHVDEYKQSTMWHYHNDFGEFETLLAEDIEALASSKDSVGGMIILIHESLAFIKRAMGLYELMQPYTGEVTVTAGESPRDKHYSSVSGRDSEDSISDFSSKMHKRKRRKNKAKKSKKPKIKR